MVSRVTTSALKPLDFALARIERVTSFVRGLDGALELWRSCEASGQTDRPVKLEPPLTVAVCFGDFFDAARGGGAHDERDTELLPCTSRGKFTISMDYALDPDRSDEYGRRVLDSENGRLVYVTFNICC